RWCGGRLGAVLAWTAAGFFAFVVASGAGAGVAEPLEAPGAVVAVFPVDFEARTFGFVDANFGRVFSVAGKLALGVLFLFCFFRAYESDSFVAHGCFYCYADADEMRVAEVLRFLGCSGADILEDALHDEIRRDLFAGE